MFSKNRIKKIFMFFLFLIPLFFIFIIPKPSLDRNWSLDQKILSEIIFFWNTVDIKNIRNFKYNSENDYEPYYYDKKYSLEELESVYYMIEPFSDYNWPAHTMLSFWFSDKSFLAVSAEIRKEVWESYSPFLGLLNKYEIVYILWDEKDLIKLRANYRKNDVFLYPIKIEKNKIKELFKLVLKRADKLSKDPEFYNTITNTCITSILKHVNFVMENYWKKKIPWSKKIFLPSNSDEIAYDLWFIDTSLTLKDARNYYKINDLSEKYADDPNYSSLIRKKRK